MIAGKIEHKGKRIPVYLGRCVSAINVLPVGDSWVQTASIPEWSL